MSRTRVCALNISSSISCGSTVVTLDSPTGISSTLAAAVSARPVPAGRCDVASFSARTALSISDNSGSPGPAPTRSTRPACALCLHRCSMTSPMRRRASSSSPARAASLAAPWSTASQNFRRGRPPGSFSATASAEISGKSRERIERGCEEEEARARARRASTRHAGARLQCRSRHRAAIDDGRRDKAADAGLSRA